MSGLLKELKDLKEKGVETIHIGSLIEFLEEDRSESDKERFSQSLQHVAELERYKAENASRLEMFRSVIVLGHNAITATFLINGSAVIALLTFLGNIWARTSIHTQARGLAWSLAFFCSGVFFSAVARGLTWWSQNTYAKTAFGIVPPKGNSPTGCPFGDRLKWGAVGTTVLSLGCFFFGMYSSLRVFFDVFGN